jgi:probable F420-dependent oxidoreductase
LAPEQAFVLEADPQIARAVGRGYVGPQFSVANYANNLRQLGYSDADLANGGSDRLVDAVVAWGNVDAIAARVQAHLDAGADHVALQPIGATLEDSLSQLAALRRSLPTGARS